jgi:hypothetical protein
MRGWKFGKGCQCAPCRKLSYWQSGREIPPELRAIKLKRGECKCSTCEARRRARRRWYASVKQSNRKSDQELDRAAAEWLSAPRTETGELPEARRRSKR